MVNAFVWWDQRLGWSGGVLGVWCEYGEATYASLNLCQWRWHHAQSKSLRNAYICNRSWSLVLIKIMQRLLSTLPGRIREGEEVYWVQVKGPWHYKPTWCQLSLPKGRKEDLPYTEDIDNVFYCFADDTQMYITTPRSDAHTIALHHAYRSA